MTRCVEASEETMIWVQKYAQAGAPFPAADVRDWSRLTKAQKASITHALEQRNA